MALLILASSISNPEKCEPDKFCMRHLGYCVDKSTACYHQHCTVSMIYRIYGSVRWLVTSGVLLQHIIVRSAITVCIISLLIVLTMVFSHKHFAFFDANHHQPTRQGGQHQRTKGLAGTSVVRSATSPDCRCQSNASQDWRPFQYQSAIRCKPWSVIQKMFTTLKHSWIDKHLKKHSKTRYDHIHSQWFACGLVLFTGRSATFRTFAALDDVAGLSLAFEVPSRSYHLSRKLRTSSLHFFCSNCIQQIRARTWEQRSRKGTCHAYVLCHQDPWSACNDVIMWTDNKSKLKENHSRYSYTYIYNMLCSPTLCSQASMDSCGLV